MKKENKSMFPSWYLLHRENFSSSCIVDFGFLSQSFQSGCINLNTLKTDHILCFPVQEERHFHFTEKHIETVNYVRKNIYSIPSVAVERQFPLPGKQNLYAPNVFLSSLMTITDKIVKDTRIVFLLLISQHQQYKTI